jgi:hypothetical protein
MEAKKVAGLISQIESLSERKGQAKYKLQKLLEVRENLFFAVKRGLPDNVEDVSSQYLSGKYGNHITKSLATYAKELENVQRRIDEHNTFIDRCDDEINKYKKQIR